jgi:hypothetical protein
MKAKFIEKNLPEHDALWNQMQAFGGQSAQDTGDAVRRRPPLSPA